MTAARRWGGGGGGEGVSEKLTKVDMGGGSLSKFIIISTMILRKAGEKKSQMKKNYYRIEIWTTFPWTKIFNDN